MGGNVLTRYQHHGERSEFRMQAYYDQTERRSPGTDGGLLLDTYDIGIPQSFAVGAHNRVILGGGERLNRYSITNGTIILSVSVEKDSILISVKGDGIGLASEAIPNLFQMFSQVDSAIDRAQGGLGFGLALVKGLIELHGGTVQVASNGIGCGSDFIIRLPGSLRVADTSETSSATPPLPTPDASRRNVLVADDNRDAADTLGLLLEMSGYAVTVAHSGQDALQKLLRDNPDAAILDIGMPDLSGYEVARRFRDVSRREDIFLLAVTGWGQQDDIARAKAAGFNEHLTKPVDPDRVERMLRSYLGGGAASAGGTPATLV